MERSTAPVPAEGWDPIDESGPVPASAGEYRSWSLSGMSCRLRLFRPPLSPRQWAPDDDLGPTRKLRSSADERPPRLEMALVEEA